MSLGAARWRTHVLSCLAFVGCALLLFRLSLFQGWTFIGDSDRLNNITNVLLFEVFSILQRGSVPSWNEYEFMGYGIAGIHWMLPGAPPLPHILAMLPLSEFYHALGILAVALFVAAMIAAYWGLGIYSSGPVQRIAGAILYATGVYTVHKLTQLDLSFVALVAPPILHRLVYMTGRECASKTFLGMAACWSIILILTVLQEVAYIGMFWGLYAVYRSARLRDPWPLVVTGLAFVAGAILGGPRIVTIATEMSVLTRTSSNIQTDAFEAVRYFSDGLLGRSFGEQVLLGLYPVNLHEGVQLLGSSLAALAVIVYGLVTPPGWLRLWSVALLVVLSIALGVHFDLFYLLGKYGLLGGLVGAIVAGLASSGAVRSVVSYRGLRWSARRAPVLGLGVGIVLGVVIGWINGLLGAAYPSLALQIVTMNAMLIGVPVWLLARRATRDTVQGDAAGDCMATLPSGPPAVAEDLPFLTGFVVLALAAILIPEARAVLYYSFMKVDFQHSRISVAMTLPLAALSIIFLNRFLPAGSATATRRWLTAGLVLGPILWMGREVVAVASVSQIGSSLQTLAAGGVLTLEVVRVCTSLLVLLVAATLLVRRAPPSWLAIAGGVLVSWIVLETVGLADYRLNDPSATAQDRPFAYRDYMQVPPGKIRVPSLEERAAVQQRLESDRYRSVLVEDPEIFQTHADPHLAAFWGLRLIEGYSTGSPRRIEGLPLSTAIAESHFVNVRSDQPIGSLPWELLAALNVKYVVMVDPSFWYNPAPGGSVPPFDVSLLDVTENPNPVTPRAFFSARVTPARAVPRLAGDDGRRPPPRDPPIEQPVRHSVAEGFPTSRRLSTDGMIDAKFDGDRVHVRVDAFGEDRFLVLNEMYHPLWRATVDGAPATIYPTNLVMRGILVPAGATTIDLAYDPFIYTPAGYAVMVLGVLLVGLLTWGLRHVDLVPRVPFLVRRRG